MSPGGRLPISFRKKQTSVSPGATTRFSRFRIVRKFFVTDGDVSMGGSALRSTSVSLLQRARENDRSSWERIVHVYSPLVYKWCRRYGLQDADAQDVGQDVLRSVFQNLASFRKERPGDSFRKWLKTITRNRVLDWARRHGRQAKLNRELAAIPCAGDEIIGPIDESVAEQDSERKVILRRALELVREEFEPRTWNAFWQSVIDDLPASEVAQALGVSTNVVYLSKSRVLRRLSNLLAELIEEPPLG